MDHDGAVRPCQSGKGLFEDLGLSQRDIEVYVYYAEGWSYADIGELYGVGKVTTKERIDRLKLIFKRAGLPVPTPPKRPKLGRKINLSGDLLDAVLHGDLPRLIRDKFRGE
jgi:hypothetical protein